jgi:PIN domain nuclease of toxin-antitoxin system
MLLDTHALLWFLDNDARLPPATKERIEDADTVLVSIASLWEIAIKVNIGKLTLFIPFETIETNLINLDIKILSIDFEDVLTYLSLPLHHRDPFDRILVAQAMNHSLIFISQDTQLDAYSIQRLWL